MDGFCKLGKSENKVWHEKLFQERYPSGVKVIEIVILILNNQIDLTFYFP